MDKHSTFTRYTEFFLAKSMFTKPSLLTRFISQVQVLVDHLIAKKAITSSTIYKYHDGQYSPK